MHIGQWSWECCWCRGANYRWTWTRRLELSFYRATLYAFISPSIRLSVTSRCSSTSPAQSNLGRAASQSPHWLQSDAPNSPQNCPFLSMITTPSNTPIPWPTPLSIPNGIRINSAVLPQYTLRTDRQTDRPTDVFCHISRLRSPDRE